MEVPWGPEPTGFALAMGITHPMGGLSYEREGGLVQGFLQATCTDGAACKE